MIYRITAAKSVFSTSGVNPAFKDDSAVADTLIVDPGAFLISNANVSTFLAPTGAWTVTVNGLILSTAATGLGLAAGISGVSTINIGTEGEVVGGIGMVISSPAKITNAGEITGTFGTAIILDNAGTHIINNSGVISGIGGSVQYSIRDFDGLSVEKMTNSGTINGKIDLRGGNDTFTNFITTAAGTVSGVVGDVIEMGDGADKFTGGNNVESLRDGGGTDTVKLGGGNDWYHAFKFGGSSDGTDNVNGGAGGDTYSALETSGNVWINLDTIAHDLSPIAPAGLTAGNRVIGHGHVPFTDIISNFENAIGGNHGDVLYGNAGINALDGRGAGDNLFGYGGNDVLAGGDGSDGLAGGTGKDTLIGGTDDNGDWFQFFSVNDSGVTKATRDVITDFQDDIDLIDLSFIDANSLVAGDQAFTFIGTHINFTGVAGQMRAIWSGSGQIIQGDVNGDKIADFSIGINDPTHSIGFTSSNFLA